MNRNKLTRRFSWILALGIAGPPLVISALEPPPQSRPPVDSGQAGTGTPQEPDETRFRFQVDVETVNLDVVVIDARGRFVEDLTIDDFAVYEDGEPKELTYFTAAATPVNTLLLLDTSSSVRSSISAIQTAAYIFVQRLGEGDSARIGAFDQQTRFASRFTDDRREHLVFIQSMRPGGKTALYDAILIALDELQSVQGRRALLLLSDGDDSGPPLGSVASQEEALEAARLSGASVYAVGFKGWNDERGQGTNREFLERLSLQSGGRVFFADEEENIQESFIQIHRELHRQYHLAYPLVPAEGGGVWRGVEVRLPDFPQLTIRARQGYYAHAAERP